LHSCRSRAVALALDVPEGIWHEPGTVRDAGASLRRRKSRDEDDDDLDTSAIRISACPRSEHFTDRIFCSGQWFLRVGTPTVIWIIVLVGAGLVRSMQFTSLNTLAFSEVPSAEISAASMLHSAAQQLTFGLGIAFGAISLRIGILLGVGQTLADYRIAFSIVAALALLTFPAFLRLAHDAGAEVSGRAKGERKLAD